MVELELEEYRRYGRQMILREIGRPGQLAIKASSVLVVGAGGLGCPAIAYLAGAGVGRLGIIDGDTVSLSNCHRQILYSDTQGGTLKVHAAAAFVASLNPNVQVIPFTERLSVDNVEDVFRRFDVVLDCTDNQTTRYLVSDACVLLKLPLVSGSALKTDGQLAIYNYLGGPCYRCIFPHPTPREMVESCGDAGILGPVVGVIGVMQALETIKLITRHTRHADHGHGQGRGRGQEREEGDADEPYVCTLTLFSAFADVPWRTVTLRRRSATCKACAESSTMSFASLKEDAAALEEESAADQQVVGSTMRMEAADLVDYRGLILDVRNSTQHEITRLPGSINVPIESVAQYKVPAETANVLVICRNGVDSMRAVQQLQERFPHVKFADLRGGLAAYAKVNQTFPFC